MKTCSYTYLTLRTHLSCRVMGVERTWEYFRNEFDRKSDGLTDPTVKYFETIGAGPKLFAVVDQSVYYHDQEQWFKYRSSYDIVHGTMEIPD